MSIAELLNGLRAAWVEVAVDGGDLVLRPASRVPAGLVPKLREAKPALLAYLRPPPGWPAGVPMPDRVAELLGGLGELVRAARRRECPGCSFPVAIGWINEDAGCLWWSCPACSRDNPGRDAQPLGPDGWPADAIRPPRPCRKCRSLDLWQDLSGYWHCRFCEPPAVHVDAEALRAGADKLRQA